MKRVLGVAFYTLATLLVLSTAEEDIQKGEINKIIDSSRELHNDIIIGDAEAKQKLQALFSTFFKSLLSKEDANTEDDEYGLNDDGSSDSAPSCEIDQSYKTRYPDDCNKYYKCENGSLTVEKCYYYQNFDVITHSCRIYWSVDCNLTDNTTASNSSAIENGTSPIQPPTADEPTCEKGESFKSKYPGTCNKYYNCNDGKLTVEKCIPLFYFDEEYEKCRFYWFVDCDSSRPPIGPPIPTTTEAPLRCGPNDNVNYPDPSSCKQYFHCENGVIYNLTCANFLLFDDPTRKCVVFYLATCAQSGGDELYLGSSESEIANWEDYEGLRNNEYKEESSLEKRDILENRATKSIPFNSSVIKLNTNLTEPSTTEAEDKPTCEKGQSFKSKYPRTCNKYYNCNDGKLTVEKCTPLFYFDEEYEKCRFYWFVECEYSKPAPIQKPTETPIDCRPNEYAYYPDPKSCKQYFYCENGVVSNMTCPKFLLFDNGTRKCVVFYLATCAQSGGDELYLGSSESEIANWDENVPTTTACYPGQFYRHRHPHSCKQFYDCKNGTLTVESCPIFKNYDCITQSCLYVWLVDCNATEPPITTEF